MPSLSCHPPTPCPQLGLFNRKLCDCSGRAAGAGTAAPLNVATQVRGGSWEGACACRWWLGVSDSAWSVSFYFLFEWHHPFAQEEKSRYQFSLLELEALAAANRVDQLLYGHAVGRLLRDVAEVEATTGTRLLCLQ